MTCERFRHLAGFGTLGAKSGIFALARSSQMISKSQMSFTSSDFLLPHPIIPLSFSFLTSCAAANLIRTSVEPHQNDNFYFAWSMKERNVSCLEVLREYSILYILFRAAREGRPSVFRSAPFPSTPMSRFSYSLNPSSAASPSRTNSTLPRRRKKNKLLFLYV